MATRQRSRAPRETSTPSASQAVMQGEPDAIIEGQATPPVEARFQGQRVPHREREAQIAEAAYLRAERRGFTPGLELQDWLEAERELEALMSARETER